jgi:hypothetical protein
MARFLTVALLLAASGCIWSQSTGLLAGTVVDTSGAAVAQAMVICRNTETGLSYSQQTNDDGIFRFPVLPVGTYEVSASHPSFSGATLRGIQLVTGQSVQVTVQLKVGATENTVVVHAPEQEIQLTSSVLQTSLESASMGALPLNGRNPLQLTYLSTGTINTASLNEGAVGWQGANDQIAVNGNRGTDNNYELDGVTFTDPNLLTTPVLPNPDALEEFTVKSANFDATQRGAGSSVQFTTRSGTDRLHGEVFEFFRNQGLDSRNYFLTGPTKVPFKRNQYGGTLGGPIIKNRTFFFTSYQGERQVGGVSPSTSEPPTAAERTGNFAGYNTIYDPMTGAPFPQNVIPSDRITPLGASIAALFPLPNTSGGGNTYEVTPRADTYDSQILGRVDDNLTSKDHLFGRYFFDNYSLQSSGGYSDFYDTTVFHNQSLVVSDTHTFSPNLLLTAAFAYSRFPRTRVPTTPTTMQTLGAQVPVGQSGFPPMMDVNDGSYGSLSASATLTVDPQIWEYRGNLIWQHEKHMIELGADALQNQEYSIDPNLYSGDWTFNGSRTASLGVTGTGDPFADLLLGLPEEFTQNAVTPEDISEIAWMAWIQDNWRIRPTVTLDLGVGWEPWQPASDSAGPMVGFEPGVQSTLAQLAPPGLVFSGDKGIPRGVLHNTWPNFSPRIGFAWNVGGKDKTVVRSAYGVFFRPAPFNLERFSAPASAFRSLNTVVIDPLSAADPYGNVAGGDPFPWTPPTVAQLKDYVFPNPVVTVAFDPHNSSSYVQQWNLTVQRQVFQNTGVTLAYLGNRMVNGEGVEPGNVPVYGPGATEANLQQRRPYQGIGYLEVISSFQHSNYNALQLTVTAKNQNGMTVLGNYVYSKCMDNSSDTAGDDVVIYKTDPNLDYARCDFNATQVGNLSLVYDLPRVSQLRGAANKVVNDWELSSILSVDTGFPFTVSSGVDDSLTGPADNDSADIIASSNRPRGVNQIHEYFNTAAYVPNAVGTFGDSGRNSLTAPNDVEWDFGLLKNLVVAKEGLNAQFRFEAFNLPNHPNFSAPESTLTSPQFGKILTANSPRVIQFAMKLMF